MANIDLTLKRVLVVTVFSCLVVVWLVCYVHACTQYRQSRRTLIYLQARRLAAEEQRQRALDYQKRLEQMRRTQEFNQQQPVRYQNGPAR